MDIIDLLNKLLDLREDWAVKNIIVNTNFKEIDIFVEYTKTTVLCPVTKAESKIYDLRPSRRLRHLDLFDYKTFINACLPRVINEKSEVHTIELSWAGGRVGYTYLFECKVIEALKMSKNQTKTSDFFDTTFDIVHGIMQRGVARGLERRNLDGIIAPGIDEKSYGNGQKYISILATPSTNVS